MPTINGRACVVNGTPVDKVFSNGKQVYGRNLIADSGFESGKTPVKYVWGDGKDADRLFLVVGQVPSFPTPLGNYMLRIENDSTDSSIPPDQFAQYPLAKPVYIKKGETWTYSYYYVVAGSAVGRASDYVLTNESNPVLAELSMGHDARETSGGQKTWHRFVKTWTADRDVTVTTLRFGFIKTSASQGWLCIDNIKLEKNATVSPWSPNTADPEYNSWRYDLTGNVSVGTNLLTGTGNHTVTGTMTGGYLSNETTDDFLTLFQGLEGQTVTVSLDYEYSGFVAGSGRNQLGWEIGIHADSTLWVGQWYYPNDDSGSGRISRTFVVPENITSIEEGSGYIQFSGYGTGTLSHLKLEKGSVATPWCPNPVDPEYNSWRYSLASNVSIPYSGTVPCNQLEQGFTVQLIAMGASSSLSFKIDDTELTYSGAVAAGDVFIFSGFSYTKNGLSIVNKTNKAYFVLQPDKPNRITCNVPGTVKILGLQNLYA